MEGFEYTALHIAQHKRFALRAHPNSAFGGASFMLGTLYEIAHQFRGSKWRKKKSKNIEYTTAIPAVN